MVWKCLSHQEVNTVDSVAESLYISSAQHIRNAITSTPRNASFSFLQTQEGSDVHTDMESSRPLLEDCRTEQCTGKDRKISALMTPLGICGERKYFTQIFYLRWSTKQPLHVCSLGGRRQIEVWLSTVSCKLNHTTVQGFIYHYTTQGSVTKFTL